MHPSGFPSWSPSAIAWAVLDVAVVLAFWLRGAQLEGQANEHLREPNRTYWESLLSEPEQFTEQGQPLRERAMRFWNRGGLAVLGWFLLRWWFWR
jgi:hypothetical protein